VAKDDGGFHLDIGKSVQDALKRYDPYFELWTETDFLPAIRQNYKPSAQQTLAGIVGDFNGDKIKDVALLGRSREHNLLVAVISQAGGTFKVFEVERRPLTDPRRQWTEGPKGKEQGLWTFLSFNKPGLVTSRFEKAPLKVTTDSFLESYFESAAVLYYFKDGEFHKYTLND
jgi:hypothetical protein